MEDEVSLDTSDAGTAASLGVGGGEVQAIDYQAISIVLHDAHNKTLHGTLNFTVWRHEEEEEEYDQEGAAYYVIAVVLVYGLSMVLLIASLAKKKMGDKNHEMEEGQVHRFLEQMPDLREKNARDNYRQLKQDIRALVNKDSNATTTSSVGSPPISPPPDGGGGGGNAKQKERRPGVSFKPGETVAKDDSGRHVLVVSDYDAEQNAQRAGQSGKVARPTQLRMAEGGDEKEKEYLLSVSKSGFSEDSASSVLDHSNNSRTGLLKDNSPTSPPPKSKYDKVKDWPIENPSDIWVSYEPETAMTSSGLSPRMSDDRIPLGYSPASQHKHYNLSLPNSPSPNQSRRQLIPTSASNPATPQREPTMLRTYYEPLKSEASPMTGQPCPISVTAANGSMPYTYDNQYPRLSVGSLEESIHDHLHSPRSRSPQLNQPVTQDQLPSSYSQAPSSSFAPYPQIPPPQLTQPPYLETSIDGYPSPYSSPQGLITTNPFLASPTTLQSLPPHQRRSWGGIPSQYNTGHIPAESPVVHPGLGQVGRAHTVSPRSSPLATDFYQQPPQGSSSQPMSQPKSPQMLKSKPVTKPLPPPSPNARRLAGNATDSPQPSRIHRPLQRISPPRIPGPPTNQAAMSQHPAYTADEPTPQEVLSPRRNSSGQRRSPSPHHIKPDTPDSRRGSTHSRRTPSPHQRDHQSRRTPSPSNRAGGQSPTPTFIGGRHVTADVADTVKTMSSGNKSPSDLSKDDLMQVTCL